MDLKNLSNEDLYIYLKIGDILATKFMRESQMNENSEKEYKKIGFILNKLHDEANKRLEQFK